MQKQTNTKLFIKCIFFYITLIICFLQIKCISQKQRVNNIEKSQNHTVYIRFLAKNIQETKPIPLLTCETANKEEERAKGLMFRTSLPENNCMFFVFEKSQVLSFWMKNTQLPLSISFLDENKTIISITDLTPFDLNPTSSVFASRYAIEVNQGWFSKYNIRTNDKIEILTSN